LLLAAFWKVTSLRNVSETLTSVTEDCCILVFFMLMLMLMLARNNACTVHFNSYLVWVIDRRFELQVSTQGPSLSHFADKAAIVRPSHAILRLSKDNFGPERESLRKASQDGMLAVVF
jgi:hypothetical protein